MPLALANPERSWEPNPETGQITSEDIERRLGAPVGVWTLLSGGLVNANVRVDAGVLRIYRRDPRALAVEAALLRRPWASDIGQLLRWAPPGPFVHAFANAYVAAGGVLPADYQKWAALLDLVNLVGLVADPSDIAAERRVRDVSARVALTLAQSGN